MVQDMPTPIMSTMDHCKTPVYMNGNMTTTHHPQLAIPVAVPMPIFPHHHHQQHFYHHPLPGALTTVPPPPQPPPPPSQYTTPPPPITTTTTTTTSTDQSTQSYCEYLYRFGFMQGKEIGSSCGFITNVHPTMIQVVFLILQFHSHLFKNPLHYIH